MNKNIITLSVLLLTVLGICFYQFHNYGLTQKENTIQIGIKYDQPGLGFKDGTAVTGFDVEIAKYIALKMGYSEGDITWKEAPSKQRETLISNGSVDFIIGSYSITPERQKIVSFAGPYYVAGQDLMVRADDDSINGPEDLVGKKLCSVTGSTSAENVRVKYGDEISLMEQPGYAECMTALIGGVVDALTTDDILLAGLAAQSGNGRVKIIGNQFSEEYYGIGIKMGNTELGTKINNALDEMKADGTWQQLFDKYFSKADFQYDESLNPPTNYDISIIESQKATANDAVAGFTGENIKFLFDKYDIIKSFGVNLGLTFWSFLFSMILGIILVVMRICPVPSLRLLSSFVVEFFRNIPLTIVMVFMVLGIWTQLDVSFSSNFDTNFFWLAVAGLSVYHSAFFCEAFRSGINTVPIGQAEAARSLGFNFKQSVGLVILPQAFRGSIAPLGNTFIALLKNTTVATAASVATETSSTMSKIIEFNPEYIFVTFLIFAIGYCIIVIPIGLIITYFSKKLAIEY
jgi:glutamate transport system substrate-binding protein